MNRRLLVVLDCWFRFVVVIAIFGSGYGGASGKERSYAGKLAPNEKQSMFYIGDPRPEQGVATAANAKYGTQLEGLYPITDPEGYMANARAANPLDADQAMLDFNRQIKAGGYKGYVGSVGERTNAAVMNQPTAVSEVESGLQGVQKLPSDSFMETLLDAMEKPQSKKRLKRATTPKHKR